MDIIAYKLVHLEKEKKKNMEKGIAVLNTGMLKYVKAFNPIHSDHVNEASVFLKRWFFLSDVRGGDKKYII